MPSQTTKDAALSAFFISLTILVFVLIGILILLFKSEADVLYKLLQVWKGCGLGG